MMHSSYLTRTGCLCKLLMLNTLYSHHHLPVPLLIHGQVANRPQFQTRWVKHACSLRTLNFQPGQRSNPSFPPCTASNPQWHRISVSTHPTQTATFRFPLFPIYRSRPTSYVGSSLVLSLSVCLFVCLSVCLHFTLSYARKCTEW